MRLKQDIKGFTILELLVVSDGKPNVLIDDHPKNIREWEAKGGIGILHTSVSKSMSELKRLGFK